MNSHSNHIKIYIKLIIVTFLWGGTFIAGHVIAQAIPPVTAATLRFLVATVVLVALTYKIEGKLPKLNRKQFFLTLLIGIFGIFAYNILFFKALSYMEAGRTALFVTFNPFITALLLAIFLGERLGKVKWIGIVTAFVGAAIIITRGSLVATFQNLSHSIGTGEISMLSACLAWSCYTILGKYALKGLSPLVSTTYASLWGLLFLAAAALFELPQINLNHFNWQVIASIVYLGVFGTVVGFIWYYQGVKEIGPSRTAVFSNLTPVFGVCLSALLLKEQILLSMIIGGSIVILGISLTNKKASRG